MFKLPKTSRLEFLIFKFLSELERLQFSTLTSSVIHALSIWFAGNTTDGSNVSEFTISD